MIDNNITLLYNIQIIFNNELIVNYKPYTANGVMFVITIKTMSSVVVCAGDSVGSTLVYLSN